MGEKEQKNIIDFLMAITYNINEQIFNLSASQLRM